MTRNLITRLSVFAVVDSGYDLGSRLQRARMQLDRRSLARVKYWDMRERHINMATRPVQNLSSKSHRKSFESEANSCLQASLLVRVVSPEVV